MTARPGFTRHDAAHLADELRRLDLLIRRRLRDRVRSTSRPAGPVGTHGLHLRRRGRLALARRRPGRLPGARAHEALDALTAAIDGAGPRPPAAGVAWRCPALGRLFGLSAVELRAVVICLAPELRRKYDRLYA